jgi:hypothetical protein
MIDEGRSLYVVLLKKQKGDEWRGLKSQISAKKFLYD